jgi:hypothetical protein
LILQPVHKRVLLVCQPLCELLAGVEHESQSFKDRGRVLRDKLCSPIRNSSLD